ncbi:MULTISPECIES: response regulator transcription factor [Marinomonas]|uniref:Response regulator transcription factor n=1 Tax=Marinomonas rhodophyticola TaxID=2992803 RepID=A0ABT3KGM8_9GAMM|nr:response regulator transcription factor [Marinomonas sp. KJ51-3]MCW4629692.1 response regulator transcription factor [Marinomonas sp. KJ51-3]
MLPISVAVVDYHPFLRLAVKAVLERYNFVVLAEADNGIDAIQLLKNTSCQLMILDLDIPQMSGLEVIRRVKQRYPDTRILVLTAQDPSMYAVRCIEAGAYGIISKAQPLEELAEAARLVLKGKKVFPQSEFYGEQLAGSESVLLASLSNRELQIVELLCKGHANKDIAETMAISHKTVSTHKTNILAKLNLGSSMELFDFAKRHNLL